MERDGAWNESDVGCWWPRTNLVLVVGALEGRVLLQVSLEGLYCRLESIQSEQIRSPHVEPIH